MDVLRTLLFVLGPLLTSCQITYYARGLSEGLRILSQRKPIEDVIKDPGAHSELKAKLALATSVRDFAASQLGLKPTKNYTTYVDLKRPFVSWTTQVAPEFSLEPYRWWFPIVGRVPYKGFFSEAEARSEAGRFDPEEYDTWVRGVTAFSTLGWFEDPMLSSMMSYGDFQLAELVIHESVHSTLFISGQADFNEQLATYLGEQGARAFFLSSEGPSSPTLLKEERTRKDDMLFKKFLNLEIAELSRWYGSLAGSHPHQLKAERLRSIQQRFSTEILPQLSTERYQGFAKIDLNNAYLAAYATYHRNLSDFERLGEILGHDFRALLEFCKNLEKAKDPTSDLKQFISAATN